MTTPNYDDILNALDRTALLFEGSYVPSRARLLREAMDIVRERRDQGESERPPQEIDCSANEAERLEAALRNAIEDIREASDKGLLASGPEIADRLEGLIKREVD